MSHDAGLVYVLASERYPGVVKVGKTTRCAHVRLGEVAKARGYRGFAPWRLAGFYWTPACSAVEAEAKRQLRHHRIWLRVRSRELFRVDAGLACQVVLAATLTGPAPPPLPYSPRRPPAFLRRLNWWLAIGGLLAWILVALTAQGQTLHLEDRQGRPAGRLEQTGPDRWRLQDHYGRPQGTLERQGDRLIQRDPYGRRADPDPEESLRRFLAPAPPPMTGGPRY